MFASIPRWLRLVVYVQVALIFAIPMGGWILQSAGEAADMQAYPPPGKMVDLGGRRIHVYCEGERGAGPLVVFNADISDQGLVWRGVQKLLGGLLRSCAIDRAGLGWSDPGPEDRSITATARELHRVLAASGEAPPYLAVGHGLGALQVLVMAREFPSEIGGFVLVDPLPPDCLKQRLEKITAKVEGDAKPAIRAKLDEILAERGPCPDGDGGSPLLSWLARIGMIRALAGSNFDATAPLPELLPVHRALKLRTQAADAILAESRTAYVGLADAREALSLLKTRRSIVLSRGRMGNYFKDQDFLEQQAEPSTLAFERAQLRYLHESQKAMLPRAQEASFRIATESGHYIPITQPELIAEAITEVAASGNAATASPPPNPTSTPAAAGHGAAIPKP
ncbi:MAG: alpha/beta hydrolase [Bryobacterales bacterium]|nr:alpha/beta hydrolase [Bryobacterales bacterium]